MLEGVVQVVCPHCDRDNRLPRDRLRNASSCVACRGVLFERRPEPLDDERRFQIPLAGREFDPPEVMSKLGG